MIDSTTPVRPWLGQASHLPPTGTLRRLVTAALDDTHHGPFPAGTYLLLLDGLRAALDTILDNPSDPAPDKAMLKHVATVFENVSRRALAETANGLTLDPGPERDHGQRLLDNFRAALADPASSHAELTEHSAAFALATAADLRHLADHPASTGSLLAEAVLAARGGAHTHLPTWYTDDNGIPLHPMTPAGDGSPLDIMIRLAAAWTGTPADLATATAGIQR